MAKDPHEEQEEEYKEKYVNVKRLFRDLRRDHAKLATRYAKTVARIRQTRGERDMLLTELSRYNPSDFDSDESDHETEAEDDENESLFPPPRSEPSSSSVVRPIRRRKKDPAAPKRPSNPFMLFAKDRRRALFDANPSATMSEVAKVLGTQWKEADAETKRKYQTMYEIEKEKYEQKMLTYTGTQALK